MSIEHDALDLPYRNKGINSKVKGSRNELVVAKLFTSWTGVHFTRTPSSGGLRWHNSPDVIGDLVCGDRDFYFPFVIEAKHYKSLKLCTPLKKTSVIYKFWKQVTEDSIRAKKEPLLVVRENGMKANDFFIFVSLDFSNYLTSLGLESIYDGSHIKGYLLSSLLMYDYSTISNYVKKI